MKATIKHFNSLDWQIDGTGLFADNKKTGERILLERFEPTERDGIIMTNTGGTMDLNSYLKKKKSDDYHRKLHSHSMGW